MRYIGNLKFSDIHRYFLLKFVHHILYADSKIFNDHFINFLPSHQYLTRNNRINLPPNRLDIERQFTIYQVCKLINEIDEGFLLPQSKHKLKNEFKKSCLLSYE